MAWAQLEILETCEMDFETTKRPLRGSQKTFFQMENFLSVRKIAQRSSLKHLSPLINFGQIYGGRGLKFCHGNCAERDLSFGGGSAEEKCCLIYDLGPQNLCPICHQNTLKQNFQEYFPLAWI